MYLTGARPTVSARMAAPGDSNCERLMEAFIVSAATEVGDKMTPVMMFCFAPEDAHLVQYKPVPGPGDPTTARFFNRGPAASAAREKCSSMFMLANFDDRKHPSCCMNLNCCACAVFRLLLPGPAAVKAWRKQVAKVTKGKI